jgi:hypothetical protein
MYGASLVLPNCKSTLRCAASLVSRAGYRVRVVVPRAAGVVREAREAARDMDVIADVAINASDVTVRIEVPRRNSCSA